MPPRASDDPKERFALPGPVQALVAGLAGVAAFAAAYSLSRFVWWVCAIPAVVATLLALILIPRRRGNDEIEVAVGVTQADLEAIVGRTAAMAAKMSALVPLIGDGRVARAVGEIAEITAIIAQRFSEVPADITAAYDFLDYHLGKTFEIVDSYVRLARAPRLSESEQRELLSVAETIFQVQTLFQAHLVSLRADDIKALRLATEALKTIAFTIEHPRPNRA